MVLRIQKYIFFCPKVTKVCSIIGHRIHYKVVGALRSQRHILSKKLLYPRPPDNVPLMRVNKGLVNGHLPIIFGELSPDARLQVLPSPLEGLLHVQLKDPTVFVYEASELWQL